MFEEKNKAQRLQTELDVSEQVQRDFVKLSQTLQVRHLGNHCFIDGQFAVPYLISSVKVVEGVGYCGWFYVHPSSGLDMWWTLRICSLSFPYT